MWAVGKNYKYTVGGLGNPYNSYSSVQHLFETKNGIFKALCGIEYEDFAKTVSPSPKKRCKRCEAIIRKINEEYDIINLPQKPKAEFCEGDCTR